MKLSSHEGDVQPQLVRALWLFAIAMVVHEAEEWNIAPWFDRHFVNHTDISSEAVWLGLALMSSIIVAWIWMSTRFSSLLVVGLVGLPVVAFVGFGNALQHLAWVILFGEYAPGVITALLLVVPTAALVAFRSAQVNRGLGAYAGGWLAIGVFGAVRTYGWGTELAEGQVALHQLVIALAALVGLPSTTSGT